MQLPHELDKFVTDFRTHHKQHLRAYVRDRKGNLAGMLVAFLEGDKVVLGWSKCKLREDYFIKDFGLYLAVNRAMKKSLNLLEVKEGDLNVEDTKSLQKAFPGVPHCLQKALPMFVSRVKRYFKDKF